MVERDPLWHITLSLENGGRGKLPPDNIANGFGKVLKPAKCSMLPLHQRAMRRLIAILTARKCASNGPDDGCLGGRFSTPQVRFRHRRQEITWFSAACAVN